MANDSSANSPSSKIEKGPLAKKEIRRDILTFAVVKNIANVASLDILTFDNPVKVSSGVPKILLIFSDMAFAQLSEVLGSNGADIIEELNDDLLWS